MPKTSGGRGRARKGADAKVKNEAAAPAKAEVEKPRRGRRPGSGRKQAAAAAPPPAPVRRKGGRAAERSRKPQPVPANTRGVNLPHTLADVSRAVNVSATTIKYYLNHLPRLIEFEGHGRKRRFSDRAVQMLSDVRRMLADENKSLSQIRQELEGQTSHRGHDSHAEKSHVPSAAASHKASGSLEELMGVLIHEVRVMRGEVEKLRKTRWLPSD